MTPTHKDNHDVAPHPTTGLALCAGAGGLELGVRLALGPTHRTVGYVERDAHAAAVLVARMEDQALDQAPIWDDVATFDGRPWRGRVDLITAGFPCPPFSAAGQRRGVEDDRWLWPDIARVVREVGPQLVFLENVPGLLAPTSGQPAGLGHVLRDLAELGFDAEWSLLSAADLGAPHRRTRLWILAYRDSPRLERSVHRASQRHHGPSLRGNETLWPPRPDDHHAWAAAYRDRSRLPALANTNSTRLPTQPRGGQSSEGTHAGRAENTDHIPNSADKALANIWPPRPNDHHAWADIARAGGPQPAIRRMADGMAHRVDRLHTIGNGVVPLVAAHAFLGLARRATQPDR